MQFNDNQIATYLFCAKLPNAKTPPLTIIEWNELIRALKKHDLEPKNLLKMTPSEILNIISTEKKMIKMVKKIEDRQQLGLSMLELEELSNQGYKIMFRQNMPQRLKKKIEPKHLPPFFLCVGDTSIFAYPSLGVVGSRDANKNEIEETFRVGHEAATQGIVIVSGGARGIDHTAVDACLKNGGKAIVFPSEGLESWIKKKEIRQYVQNNQLLLVSAQHINARFTGAYAMQRNKFIHTTSHAVLVASSKILQSGKNTNSGTWSGVLENIKGQWTPLFAQGKSEGATKLLEEGYAKPFTSLVSVADIAKTKDISKIDQVIKSENKLFPRKEMLQSLMLAKESGMSEKQVREEVELLINDLYKSNSLKNPEQKVVDEKTDRVRESDIDNGSFEDSKDTFFEQLRIGNLFTQDKKDK